MRLLVGFASAFCRANGPEIRPVNGANGAVARNTPPIADFESHCFRSQNGQPGADLHSGAVERLHLNTFEEVAEFRVELILRLLA